jgi:hypothetical protein
MLFRHFKNTPSPTLFPASPPTSNYFISSMRSLPKYRLIFLLAATICLCCLTYNLILFHQSSVPIPSTPSPFSVILDLLQNNQLAFSDVISNNNRHQIELKITAPPSQDKVTVYLSLLKDPFYQVQSLQNLLKIAKMKHQTIKLINLAANHPYVTFQNH